MTRGRDLHENINGQDLSLHMICLQIMRPHLQPPVQLATVTGEINYTRRHKFFPKFKDWLFPLFAEVF